MKVIDIEKIVADYGNSVFHDDLKRVDSASAFEISAIAKKLGLNSMYDFDDTGYHLDVSSLVESLTEDKNDFKDLTIEEMFFEVAGKKFKVFDKNGHFTKEAWKLYDKVAERFGDYDKFDALCGEEGCFEDDEDIQYSANESLKESKEDKIFVEGDRVRYVNNDGWTKGGERNIGETGVIIDRIYQGNLEIFTVKRDVPKEYKGYEDTTFLATKNNLEFEDEKYGEGLEEAKEDKKDNWISVGIFGKTLENSLGDGYIQFFNDEEKCKKEYKELTFDKLLKRIKEDNNFYLDGSAEDVNIFLVDRMIGDDEVETDIIKKSNSIKEAVEEEDKLETFEDKMNFLAKDEQEAIDGYDKVIALLDAEKDAIVIEQLNKIKIEEEAHKKYLEDVKENHDLVYTEPLDLEEGASYRGLAYYEYPEGSGCHVRETPSCFVALDRSGSTLGDSKTKAGAEAIIDEHNKNKVNEDFTEKGKQLIKDARDAGLINFYDPYAGNFSFTKEIYDENQEKIQKWLENHDEYGVIRQEASIYKDTDLENSSDGYAYFLTDWGFDEDESASEDIIIKPKALSEDLNEKVEYIEMPHEVYETPEDIKRINDELDKKAREGKLIGIRKEPRMLQLAEPEIKGIWTIYLNDKGFIEKIVVF